MCDCYEGKCEGCGVAIPIHIADFSANRDHVKAWCPACHDEFYDYQGAMLEEDLNRGAGLHWRVTSDELKSPGQVWGHKSGKVIFLVIMPHGIRLN